MNTNELFLFAPLGALIFCIGFLCGTLVEVRRAIRFEKRRERIRQEIDRDYRKTIDEVDEFLERTRSKESGRSETQSPKASSLASNRFGSGSHPRVRNGSPKTDRPEN
jgi:hypothetical protein